MFTCVRCWNISPLALLILLEISALGLDNCDEDAPSAPVAIEYYSMMTAKYSEALLQNPNDPFILQEITLLYLDQNKFESAYGYQRRLAKVDRYMGSVLLGRILEKDGKVELADGAFSSAIELSKARHEAFEQRGHLRHKQRRHDEAAKDLTTALKYAPADSREVICFSLFVIHCEQSDFARAREMITSVIEEAEKTPRIVDKELAFVNAGTLAYYYERRAEVGTKEGRDDLAVLDLSVSVNLVPKARTLVKLADCLDRMGLKQEAAHRRLEAEQLRRTENGTERQENGTGLIDNGCGQDAEVFRQPVAGSGGNCRGSRNGK